MSKVRWDLIFALGVIVWLATALVRVENERFAMQVGLCQREPNGWDYSCIQQVQTRTSWVWHLFYALTD